MEILGIIPARGGSKGIPRKNIALLRNQPLIAYTCQAACGSSRLTRTILSTDDEDIASIVKGYGIEVPFIRPAALGTDDTPMIDVLRHAVSWLFENEKYNADVVVVLQPTSPLRTSEHIDAAVNLFAESGAGTVVSVVRVPHQFSPSSLMLISGGMLTSFQEGQAPLRRQDKLPLYARNGPAVLVLKRSTLELGDFYSGKVVPFEMDRSASVDIDDEFDLALAEFWLGRKAGSL